MRTKVFFLWANFFISGCVFSTNSEIKTPEFEFLQMKKTWDSFNKGNYSYKLIYYSFARGKYTGDCEVSNGISACLYVGLERNDTLLNDDPGRIDFLFTQIDKNIYGGISNKKYQYSEKENGVTTLFSKSQSDSNSFKPLLKYRFDPTYGFPDSLTNYESATSSYKIISLEIK